MNRAWWTKFILLVSLTTLSILYVIPTVFRLDPETTKFPFKQKINLGLDLQGGLYMVLGVDFPKYFKDVAERQASSLQERTKEKALWLRLIGSTAVGEFADTLVFCTIAFYGVITGAEFWNYVLVGYLYKTLVEVVLLPVTYRVIAAVKRREPTYGLA